MARIVLDTDMGSDVDDALCLALALASPEIELAAITNVGAESRLRAQITRRLLELAGRTGGVVLAASLRSRFGATVIRLGFELVLFIVRVIRVQSNRGFKTTTSHSGSGGTSFGLRLIFDGPFRPLLRQ